MPAVFNEAQRGALTALCNTFVPSIQVAPDPIGFWARPASALGVDRVLERHMVEDLPPPLTAGLMSLLDALAAQGFAKADQSQRESMLSRMAEAAPAAAQAIGFFEKQTLVLNYGLPENPVPNPNLLTYGSPQGQNPNWEILGYPGPVSVPHAKPKQIQTDRKSVV